MKTVYEDQRWAIKEHAGELHVYNKREDVEFRVSSEGCGVGITAALESLEPWSVAGLPAFVVKKKCNATICSNRWKKDKVIKKKVKK